jgi:hypothetical protein
MAQLGAHTAVKKRSGSRFTGTTPMMPYVPRFICYSLKDWSASVGS